MIPYQQRKRINDIKKQTVKRLAITSSPSFCHSPKYRHRPKFYMIIQLTLNKKVTI